MPAKKKERKYSKYCLDILKVISLMLYAGSIALMSVMNPHMKDTMIKIFSSLFGEDMAFTL